MKILHLISSMDPKGGGVCRAVRDIIYGILLIDKDIVNEVVCMDNPNEDFFKNDNFKIYALGKGKTAWNYHKNLYSWLEKNRKNYDKFIVHGLWQYNSFAAYRLWKQTQLDYFVMPHGMLDPYFQKTKERKLKAIRNIIIWKFIENKLINNAKSLLFTCEEEKLLARQTFKNYFSKNEQVTGLGIDEPPVFTKNMTSAFSEKLPQWNGKPFILFLSRIHEKKGVDLLINAYLLIEQRAKNKEQRNVSPLNPPQGDFKPPLRGGLEGLQLIIAGSLDGVYANKMQKIAENNNNILFAGMLNGDAKWGAFYNCECFVLPSHQENFGIAIVEAMACSKPVIITNKVNIWREISESGGGLVGNDTEEDTYNLLKKYLTLSPEEKQAMQKNAYAAYQKYFSIEKSAEQMLKVLSNQD